jgi:hypothetical protein
VEVIIPPGFNHRQIPEILIAQHGWLTQAIAQVEAQRQLRAAAEPAPLPTGITLRAIGQAWAVDYLPTSSLKVTTLERSGDRLLMHGNVTDQVACTAILQRWLARKAHQYLAPWLHRLSQTQNLPFAKTLIRGQKTRWASCSNRKTISLNYKLLLVEAPLVDYVLIHELCHTIHLNHSAQFWRLVETHCPDYKQLNAQLRTAWRNLPLWLG